jgi:hypothetical protein
VKEQPFGREHLPRFYVEERRREWACVEREAQRRFASATIPDDDRRGIAVVYTRGRFHAKAYLTEHLAWKRAEKRNFSTRLDAKMIIDDPLGAERWERLGIRVARARAFASAANDLLKPDGEFLVRPLEIVPAEPGESERLVEREHVDALIMDLRIGIPNVRLIDLLARTEYDLFTARGFLCSGEWLRGVLWHQVDRLNAARAMFHPALPLFKVPSVAALDRRTDAFWEDRFGRERNRGGSEDPIV